MLLWCVHTRDKKHQHNCSNMITHDYEIEQRSHDYCKSSEHMSYNIGSWLLHVHFHSCLCNMKNPLVTIYVVPRSTKNTNGEKIILCFSPFGYYIGDEDPNVRLRDLPVVFFFCHSPHPFNFHWASVGEVWIFSELHNMMQNDLLSLVNTQGPYLHISPNCVAKQ